MEIKDLDFQEQLSNKEQEILVRGGTDSSASAISAIKATVIACPPPCWPPKPKR